MNVQGTLFVWCITCSDPQVNNDKLGVNVDISVLDQGTISDQFAYYIKIYTVIFAIS